MLRSYPRLFAHADAFVMTLNFFRARHVRDFVLSLQAMELVQTKNSMSLH